MPKLIEPEAGKEIEVNTSNLRFEIRKAETGHPYFAVVFRSNGNVLAASQPYTSGMSSLENAMDRLRREAYSATQQDRQHEGPLPGAASPD